MNEIKEGIYFSGVGIASLSVEHVGKTIYLRVYLTQLSEGHNIQLYQTFNENSVDFDATFLQIRKMMLNPGNPGVMCFFDECKKRFEFLYS